MYHKARRSYDGSKLRFEKLGQRVKLAVKLVTKLIWRLPTGPNQNFDLSKGEFASPSSSKRGSLSGTVERRPQSVSSVGLVLLTTSTRCWSRWTHRPATPSSELRMSSSLAGKISSTCYLPALSGSRNRGDLKLGWRWWCRVCGLAMIFLYIAEFGRLNFRVRVCNFVLNSKLQSLSNSCWTRTLQSFSNTTCKPTRVKGLD